MKESENFYSVNKRQKEHQLSVAFSYHFMIFENILFVNKILKIPWKIKTLKVSLKMISLWDCLPCLCSLKVWKHKYLQTTRNKNNIVNERGSRERRNRKHIKKTKQKREKTSLIKIFPSNSSSLVKQIPHLILIRFFSLALAFCRSLYSNYSDSEAIIIVESFLFKILHFLPPLSWCLY